MRPVAILRHSPVENPAYFAIFLESRNIPWCLFPVDAGARVPEDPRAFSGLCLMGGPMGANDALPWIAEEIALVRAAAQENIPVIGHCLGGQLIARAFGGQVSPMPAKELGWGEIACEGGGDAVAQAWLGGFCGQAASVFSWHGDMFSLPEGASRLASSAFCANQAFALGKHLALQCHVEMTPEMVEAWSSCWREEVEENQHLPSVQPVAQMRAQSGAKLPAMRRLAGQLYGEWVKGLAN
jgi:GMP synthase-like glutamine amidotransferase